LGNFHATWNSMFFRGVELAVFSVYMMGSIWVVGVLVGQVPLRCVRKGFNVCESISYLHAAISESQRP